jgi:hypothetical protein
MYTGFTVPEESTPVAAIVVAVLSGADPQAIRVSNP